MEIAEAIDILENEIPHCGKKATYTESELCEAYEMAICSLRAQHEQEFNDPLTLDELRQMDGEPVWAIELNRWALVNVDAGYVRLFDNIGLCFDLKKSMSVYRYKPKEG